MRIFFCLISACCLLVASVPAIAKSPEPGTDVVAEFFPQYNDLIVRKIEIQGLKRSRESVVRWMLGAREGAPFDAQAWQTGIEHLYKTEALYDLHTQFKQVGNEIEIHLSLQDKWTLFPYFDLQGGGGSVSFSTGVFDTNVLGTFTNMYVGGGYLDKEYSYELGISQRWFLQTHFSLAFSIAKLLVPVSFQNAEGDNQQNFTWKRLKQELTLGKQNGERFYWDIKFEAFRDSLKNSSSRAEDFVYSGVAQYRITPLLKFWKVSHSDYLEQGRELTVSFAESNPTQASRDYHAVQASWKHVIYIPDTQNIAMFLSAGHMSTAPTAYQFRLGGFDSIRGFSMNRVFGEDFARANFEYRFTLLTHHFETLDIDRVVLQSCLFTDAGQMWNAAGIDKFTGTLTHSGSRFLYSAGTGVRAIFLHFSNATARLDFAKALIPQEGFNIAFGVGQFF